MGLDPDLARRLGVPTGKPALTPQQQALVDADAAARAGQPVQGWGKTVKPDRKPKRPKGETVVQVGELRPSDTGETRLQVRVAGLLVRAGLLFTHPPNGEIRRRGVAAKLRRMGCHPGVPDLLIFTPPPARPGCLGTAIELKSPKLDPGAPFPDPPWEGPGVTEYQAGWLDRLASAGWVCLVGYTFDQLVEQLADLGYPVDR